MRRIVLDASVVVKWFLIEEDQETNIHNAQKILHHIASSQITIIQPTHWLPEVAAVLSRLRPQTAERDIFELAEMNFKVCMHREALLHATHLAIDLKHHLFDTLYHAVALVIPDTNLVTADQCYFHKARHKGSLVLLRDFSHHQ
ncbi:MAG: type II toxin-antitoxin system VapC family toxin [Desulfovermiculus sp.]